jgi:hypothetical protein
MCEVSLHGRNERREQGQAQIVHDQNQTQSQDQIMTECLSGWRPCKMKAGD